jgi:hypothetical protein
MKIKIKIKATQFNTEKNAANSNEHFQAAHIAAGALGRGERKGNTTTAHTTSINYDRYERALQVALHLGLPYTQVQYTSPDWAGQADQPQLIWE